MKHTRCLLYFSFIWLLQSCNTNTGDPPPPNPQLPVVTTGAVSLVTGSTAVANGEVTSEGSATVTTRGICYSTTPNPTTSSFVSIQGNGIGSFSASLSGLNPNSTYYVKAFATNSVGTSYGIQQSFTTVLSPPPIPIDSAVSLYISGRDSLFAFNAQTGSLKWKKGLGSNIFSSPIYANGKVYVGCTDKKLYAFDTLGNLSWTFTTSAYIGSQSPLVKNNIVYIGTEQSRDIYAINATTGSLIWQYNAFLFGGGGGLGRSDLTLYDNTLYINSGFVYALDAATGTVKWIYNNGGDITPVKFNNKLYLVNANHTLVVLNAENGNLIWQKNSFSEFTSPEGLNMANEKLLYSDHNFISAFDTINGTRLWQRNSVATTVLLQSGYSPFVLNDTAYYLTHGDAEMYNTQTGAYLNVISAEDMGYFTIADRIMYFGSAVTVAATTKWFMFAVDLNTRSNKWVSSHSAAFPFSSAPCIVTKSGKVYRFGKSF